MDSCGKEVGTREFNGFSSVQSTKYETVRGNSIFQKKPQYLRKAASITAKEAAAEAPENFEAIGRDLEQGSSRLKLIARPTLI